MSRRRRREPDQAREEILAAAGDLIARHGPDGVSLRQVADVVGVTHGLVSHYFGTYSALARAVLQRENELHHERVREQLRADHGLPQAESMTRVLLETLTDERYVRLWAWSTLHAADGNTAPAGNLRELVTAIQAGIGDAAAAAQIPDRDRIESAVLLGLSAAYGYTLGKKVWLTELGHDPADPGIDAEFRAALAAAVTVHLVQK